MTVSSVVDGRIWTSAGMSAGVDLALEMVEQDCGIVVARSVRRIHGDLCASLRRPTATLGAAAS